MKPRRTHNSDLVFRLEGGTEDNDLWVERVRDESGNQCIASVWELTVEERDAIARGENIELVVWGTEHPPVSLHTTTVPLGKGPGDLTVEEAP